MSSTEESVQTTASSESKDFSTKVQAWIWVIVAVVVVLFLLKCCTWCAKQNYRSESLRLQRSTSRVAIIDSAAPQSLTCPQCTAHLGTMTLEEYLAALENQQPPSYASIQTSSARDEDPPPPYSTLEMMQPPNDSSQPNCFVTEESARTSR